MLAASSEHSSMSSGSKLCVTVLRVGRDDDDNADRFFWVLLVIVLLEYESDPSLCTSYVVWCRLVIAAESCDKIVVVGFLVRFDFSFILRLKILARACTASSVTSVTGRFVFCSINPHEIHPVLLLLSRVSIQRTSASLQVRGLQVKVSSTKWPSTSFSECAASRRPHLIKALA